MNFGFSAFLMNLFTLGKMLAILGRIKVTKLLHGAQVKDPLSEISVFSTLSIEGDDAALAPAITVKKTRENIFYSSNP